MFYVVALMRRLDRAEAVSPAKAADDERKPRIERGEVVGHIPVFMAGA
jgi:hypothetical protein